LFGATAGVQHRADGAVQERTFVGVPTAELRRHLFCHCDGRWAVYDSGGGAAAHYCTVLHDVFLVRCNKTEDTFNACQLVCNVVTVATGNNTSKVKNEQKH
jgi:hypothetical protein